MVNPAYGWQLTPWDVRVVNRSGSTLSQFGVCMFDTPSSATETDSQFFGDENSCYATVITPTDKTTLTLLKFGVFAVAQEAIEDNERGVVRIQGKTRVNLVDNAGNYTTLAGEAFAVLTVGL